MTEPDHPITRILRSADPQASEELLPLVYEDLREIARARLARDKPGQTLQATALVHEAWLKLGMAEAKEWDGRAHFFAAASRAMRNLLVDAARRRQRRGHAEPLDTALAAPEDDLGLDMLALDEALAILEREFPRPAQVVMLRYFAGQTVNEVAIMLEVSPSTVDREWAFARAWLLRALGGEPRS